jgi:hypothetical protein
MSLIAGWCSLEKIKQPTFERTMGFQNDYALHQTFSSRCSYHCFISIITVANTRLGSQQRAALGPMSEAEQGSG